MMMRWLRLKRKMTLKISMKTMRMRGAPSINLQDYFHWISQDNINHKRLFCVFNHYNTKRHFDFLEKVLVIKWKPTLLNEASL